MLAIQMLAILLRTRYKCSPFGGGRDTSRPYLRTAIFAPVGTRCIASADSNAMYGERK